MLQRLKAFPLALLRRIGGLGRKIVRLTAIAAAVTALLIALDALFLPDSDESDE